MLESTTFRSHLSRYFSGELPHSKDTVTSILQSLMDGPTPGNPSCGLSGDCTTTLRVSLPWPNRTKKALAISLDEGIFENFHLMIPPGLGSTEHVLHFAGAADEGIGSPFSRRRFPNYHASELMTIGDDLLVCHSGLAYQHDIVTSPSTLVTNIHVHFLCPHPD